MSFPTQAVTATYLEALESRTLLSVDVLVGAGVVHGTDGAFTLEDADSYEQHTRGTLQIEIGSATSFDQIHVGGEADLSGTLELQLENGFSPTVGQTFDVLCYGSRTNLEGFDRYEGLVIGNGLFFRPTYSGDKLTLTVTQESHLKPIVFIPGFGGSFPLDESEDGLKDWLTQRGPEPDSLGLEPLRRTYQGFVESLINVGYTPQVDLLVANWDWRTPVAPHDGTSDGTLSTVMEPTSRTRSMSREFRISAISSMPQSKPGTRWAMDRSGKSMSSRIAPAGSLLAATFRVRLTVSRMRAARRHCRRSTTSCRAVFRIRA